MPVITQLPLEVNESIDIPNDQSTWMFIAGLVLISITFVIGGICLVDYYSPDTISNTPVLGSFVDIVHNAWNSVIGYFKGSDGSTGGGNSPSQDFSVRVAEAISRSSSGDSDKTITFSSGNLRTITPPYSRSATPFPNPDFCAPVPDLNGNDIWD